MYRISVKEKEFFTCRGDNTILAAARQQMVKLPYGCANGGCGMCKIKIVNGNCKMKLYSKGALSDEELAAGYVLACKAMPLGDVVLELIKKD